MLLLFGLKFPTTVQAFPLNGLMSIPSSTFKTERPVYDDEILSLELGYDFVLDTTDHEGPPARDAQLNSESIKRFEGFHIVGDFLINDNLLINLGYWNRQLANKRDILDFYTLQASVQYELPWKWFRNSYAIRLGWWRDASDRLTKSSYTRIDDYKITSLELSEPVGNQLQLNLLMSRPVTPGKQITGFIGFGLSDVDYESLTGRFSDENNCEFAFELEKKNGVINQVGRCDNIISRKITMPNPESVENNIGSNPEDDFKYSSTFFQIGVGAEWKKGPWRTRLGYYFQKFYRNGVDQRVSTQGSQSVSSSHSFTAETSYRLIKSLGIFIRGEYVSNRLLTMAPFIYNSYTAERFTKDGLFISMGIKILYS